MSIHFIYNDIEFSSLSDVRRVIKRSFPKNPSPEMLALLGIQKVERPDPEPVEPTEEEKKEAALKQAKEERAQAVAKIVVEVTRADGTVLKFDGDEVAQARLDRAISVAKITGQETTDWVMSDNQIFAITVPEAEEALAKAMNSMGKLWTKPYES